MTAERREGEKKTEALCEFCGYYYWKEDGVCTKCRNAHPAPSPAQGECERNCKHIAPVLADLHEQIGDLGKLVEVKCAALEAAREEMRGWHSMSLAQAQAKEITQRDARIREMEGELKKLKSNAAWVTFDKYDALDTQADALRAALEEITRLNQGDWSKTRLIARAALSAQPTGEKS